VAEGGGEGQAIGARSSAPDVFISYALPDAAVATALTVDPDIKSLRGDPHYKVLLGRMNLLN
jgi:hypothetical protein